MSATSENNKRIARNTLPYVRMLFVMAVSPYTSRYQDIIMQMPDDINVATVDIKCPHLEIQSLYSDLCSGEYHLYKTGVVPLYMERRCASQCGKQFTGGHGRL